MSFRLFSSVPRLINPTYSFLRAPIVRTAGFHASRACAFKITKPVNDGATFVKGSVNEAVVLPQRDKVAGSYHWDFDRLLSAALVPLTVASVINGAHPITDLCLGVILPIHCHIGFDAVITDYLPSRRTPIWNKVTTWGLRGATLIVLYGCYEFNTNDVGLTEVVKRMWHA